MPQVHPARAANTHRSTLDLTAAELIALSSQRGPLPAAPPAGSAATVYCEANFGTVDGKTASAGRAPSRAAPITRGGGTMLDLKPGTTGSAVALATSAETAGLDDAAVVRLLAAQDTESVAQLATWLKTHARTFASVVTQAIEEESGLSAEAAGAVLDALIWRAPADGETTLRLLEACLDAIAGRITESLGSGAPGAISDRDDALVGSAVVVLTSSRPSRHSETAIDCLAEAGPGGALVLARAFDAVRSALKLCIVRRLKPADVLELGDNVVASLAHSVSRLAEELESPQRDVATRFLAELGSIQRMEPSEVGTTELLGIGDRLFHASWGAGIVIAATDETVTIDFGSAGTRTLLRALATLRHAS